MGKAIISLETLVDETWLVSHTEELIDGNLGFPSPIQGFRFEGSNLMLHLQPCNISINPFTITKRVDLKLPEVMDIKVYPGASVVVSACCPIHRYSITNQS